MNYRTMYRKLGVELENLLFKLFHHSRDRSEGRVGTIASHGAADAPSPTRRRPTAAIIGDTILAVDRSSEPSRCCRVGDSSYEYTGRREAGCCCGRYSC
jgi:hypothetical protein